MDVRQAQAAVAKALSHKNSMKKHTQTAILLFARTAQVDAASKLLTDVAVMHVLNKRVLKTVQKSGIDFYRFTEHEQRGTSFGSRFTNAIEDVFNLGYKQVICLGNDTPLLTPQLIKQAVRSLEMGRAVKGKSLDGGLYLMGMHRSQFHAANFEQLPWQTAALASTFNKYITNLGSDLDILKSLEDIDSTADLRQFLAGKDARVEWIRLLARTLSRKRNNHNRTITRLVQVYHKQPANKGSPFLNVA
jgi:hypothetical protein